jgi:hypothetical protein
VYRFGFGDRPSSSRVFGVFFSLRSGRRCHPVRQSRAVALLLIPARSVACTRGELFPWFGVCGLRFYFSGHGFVEVGGSRRWAVAGVLKTRAGSQLTGSTSRAITMNVFFFFLSSVGGVYSLVVSSCFRVSW